MPGIDSYTKFISHFNGVNGGKEITDSGNTGHVITQVATASITTAQKKIDNCSVVFDGNSDYLTVPDHADWDMGTGDFTVDCWVYANTYADWFPIVGLVSGSGNWTLSIRSDTSVGLYDGTTLFNFTVSSLPTTTWFHLAVVRTGNTAKCFINGTQDGGDKDVTGSTFNTSQFCIGYNGGSYYNGYLDEYRISKGIARWTSNFTPFTTAYTSDAYTVLLLHMESLDISSTTPKIPTFVGTAQISTVQAKFNQSLLLDGNSDYVTVPDSDDWDFGTGDATFDFWVRFVSLPSASSYNAFFGHSASLTNGSYIGYIYNSSGSYRLYIQRYVGGSGSSDYVTWSTPVVDTWYHVAYVRTSGAWKIFIDGSQVGSDISDTSDYTMSSTNVFTIGYDPINTSYHNGYIDEFRASIGIARWTANFTPPTQEYNTSSGVTRQRIIVIM